MAGDATLYHDPRPPARTSVPGCDETSDQALVRRLIEGSEDALAALYDCHSQAVFAAAMRTSRDSSIAAEAVQETFLVLWNRADDFDPARGRLASWLMRIARNRAIDRLRSEGRHQATTFSTFAGVDPDDRSFVETLAAAGGLVASGRPEPAPEDAYADKETRRRISAAIASLGPHERRVIALAYDGGLTQSEIAAELAWPIGTVKTRTRRALRQLREYFEQSDVAAASAAVRPDPTPATRAAAADHGLSAGQCSLHCGVA